jgi:Domain of unknown function (DUF5666)
MRSPTTLLACASLAVFVVSCEAQQSVTFSGFVTRVDSNCGFDVNGFRIICDGRTETIERSGKASATRGCPKVTPYVGESVTIRGAFHEQDRSVSAEKVAFAGEPSGTVAGSAVIDALPAPKQALPEAGSLLVRADGYRILITGKALIVLDPPLHSLAEVSAGDWIHYEGRRRPDGTVVAQKVRLTRIAVSGGEQTFRFKSDYDPSRVPASAKQNVLHEVFLGEDYKNIPPSRDLVTQARVEAIGNKLIPAFQQNLASSDPAKINFRFQVTDDPKWLDVTPLPSGIILIPLKATERMQNDSQLAAILAGSIAAILERGPFRMRKAINTATTAAYVAYWPTGPGIGNAARSAARRKQEEQGDRVGLWLMHDAGYDIDQAPIAWWLLAPKVPKPMNETAIPERAADLYRVLGQVWNNPAATALHDH